MKKETKRKYTACFVILLLAVFFTGSTFSYFQQTEKEVNRLQLGDIEVDLKEDWDKEDGEAVEAGDTVVKAPRVSALAGDMYLRMKMMIHEVKRDGSPGEVITDEEQLGLILDTLYLDSGYPETPLLDRDQSYSITDLDQLIQNESIQSIHTLTDFTLHRQISQPGIYYFRYTGAVEGVLEEGDYRYFTTHMIIPAEWDEAQTDILGSYGITFQVQAIQADAFSTMEEAHAALPDAIAAQEAEDLADQPGISGE